MPPPGAGMRRRRWARRSAVPRAGRAVRSPCTDRQRGAPVKDRASGVGVRASTAGRAGPPVLGRPRLRSYGCSCSASIPASPAAATACSRCRGRRRTPAGRPGRHHARPPSDRCTVRLAELQPSCGRCSSSSAGRGGASSGCCSRSTCAPPCRSARPAASPWPRRWRPVRRRGVLAQRGQGGRHRVRRRRQGAGAADGPGPAGPRPAPRAADAADAAAVALCHPAMAPTAAIAHADGRRRASPQPGAPRCARPRRPRRSPLIGSLRGTLLERWPAARCWSRSPASATGSPSPPPPSSTSASPAPRSSSTSTTTAARTPRPSTGSLRPTSAPCFEALLGAHGVGPSLALAILGVHPPSSLQRVLADDDLAALCLVPGVGKKTAARLLVELKSRLDIGGPTPWPPVTAPSGDGGGGGRHRRVADVRDALANLGYGPDEVAEVVRELPDEADTSDAAAPRPAAAGGALMPRRAALAGAPSRRSTTRPTDGRPSDGGRLIGEEGGLRPRSLDEFVGQRELKEHLHIILEAARRRGQAVDHLLFAGPPGLGKTTLAGIVAAELEVGLHVTSGPALDRPGRPGRHPHPARRGRRAVHRRDPPAQPHRRGGALPGAWRTSSSTSCSARAPPPGRSASTCPGSPSSGPPPAPG